MEYTYEQLSKRYDEMTGRLALECEFSTELVGGVPADKKSLLYFVTSHMGIAEPEEVSRMVSKILKTEGIERNMTLELGELDEAEVYQVLMIRGDERGPYLGNWMPKACLKAAASRLRIFNELRGIKGNFAEGGLVRAAGISLNGDPGRIYLRDPSGTKPAPTYYQQFMGRVNTPKGATSIVHHSECCAPGTRFEFEFLFLPDARLKETDLVDMVSLAMIIGLGSVKALERGKFKVNRCSINLGAAPISRTTAKKAP